MTDNYKTHDDSREYPQAYLTSLAQQDCRLGRSIGWQPSSICKTQSRSNMKTLHTTRPCDSMRKQWTTKVMSGGPALPCRCKPFPWHTNILEEGKCCAICPASELLSPPSLPGPPKLPRLCESCDQSTGSEEHPHLPEWTAVGL